MEQEKEAAEREAKLLEEKGFYDGERVKGQRHGYGTFYFYNGARYTGDWQNGLKHGSGRFVFPDGSIYDGQWWQNQKHGYGRYTYPNGDVHDGQWQLDKRQGHGLYHSVDINCYYQGYWHNEKLNGPVQIFMNDVKYSGYFVNNHVQGPGVFVLPNNFAVYGKHVLRGKKDEVSWMPKGFGPAY